MRERKKKMKTTGGGVCAPQGFSAAGVHAGLKKNGKKDMALIYSRLPAVSAGVYTTNVVKAWCVRRNQEITAKDRPVRAVIVNSGCANACTGEEGERNNILTAEKTAALLGVQADEVLTGSTGVIGRQLPVDTMIHGASLLTEALTDGDAAALDAASAIMTTDTKAKTTARSVRIGGTEVRIGAMVKGSGMIHPNMATMLCYITTDVSIAKPLLQKALKDAIVPSFNMISVDGDTSTNDMAVMMANGAACNPMIETEDADYAVFAEAVRDITLELAREMVRDGEGATKLIEVRVHGAATHQDAVKMAKSVITSELVKTMFFGEDANFGRIACAAGYSGVRFDPARMSIRFISKAGEISMLEDGTALPFDEEKALAIMREEEITVDIGIREGEAEAVAWGSDLSHEYVSINGDYRS